MIPGIKLIDDILKGLPENARLREQLAELRSQVEQLESRLKSALAEVQRLKEKYESPASRLSDEQWESLRVLATKDDFWPPQEVADETGIDVVRVQSLLAKLKIEDYVFQTMRGFHISTGGRAALL